MSYIRVGAIYSISTTQYRCQPCGLLANWCALHASCTDAPHCNASRHRFTRSLNTLRSNLLRTRCSALASKRDDADPGHWEYSPEWWGTHAGGWGRDAGRTLFAQQSRYGNGEVTVTAHPASPIPGSTELEHQWRVLRFNETRQSVSRVVISTESLVPQADAACLAFEYLKTMASAAAVVVGTTGKLEKALQPVSDVTGHVEQADRHASSYPKARGNPQGRLAQNGRQASRALCIGLGGGSLPNFLSHHFPGLQVDAVELDPLVVTAATDYMGFPRHRPNMQLHQADAADYLMRVASEVQQGSTKPLDMVFVDAFDGNDDVPASLCNSDSKVLNALSEALHPVHGTVVMNLHGGGVPTTSALVALFTGWLPFASNEARSGYHQNTEKGQAVQQIARTLREKLLSNHEGGSAFTLSVQRQSNIVVVVTRGMDADTLHHSTAKLQESADQTSHAAGFLFDCRERSSRGLTLI